MRRSNLAAAALFVTFNAVPASAATMIATITGTLGIVHYDTFFGAATNDQLKVVFRFDPNKGTPSPYNGATEATRNGYHPNAPLTSVALTINGRTDNLDIYPGGNYYSDITKSNYGTISGFYLGWQAGNAHYVNNLPTSSNDYQQGGASVGVAGSQNLAFDAPFSGNAIGGNIGFLRQVQNTGRGYDLAYWFNATPTSITVQTATAVPEPESWVLLVAGFGLVGTMARRRSAATKVAA